MNVEKLSIKYGIFLFICNPRWQECKSKVLKVGRLMASEREQNSV